MERKKYFTLNYILTKEDYKRFHKSVNSSLSPKRIRTVCIILAASLLFVIFGLFSLGVTIFFVSMTTFFLMDLVDIFYTHKLGYKSKRVYSPLFVNFYNDHLEVIIDENPYCKVRTESHYPLDTVKVVYETRTDFYFKFQDQYVLIIPKSKINFESSEKIRNMCLNIYSKIFLEEP